MAAQSKSSFMLVLCSRQIPAKANKLILSYLIILRMPSTRSLIFFSFILQVLCLTMWTWHQDSFPLMWSIVSARTPLLHRPHCGCGISTGIRDRSAGTTDITTMDLFGYRYIAWFIIIMNPEIRNVLVVYVRHSLCKTWQIVGHCDGLLPLLLFGFRWWYIGSVYEVSLKC